MWLAVLLAPGAAAQDLPRPPAGPGPCRAGYGPRQAAPDDHVCVSAEARERVAAENKAAPSHLRLPGTDACAQGFVWRAAFPGDHVCVALPAREAAAAENEAEAEHGGWPAPPRPVGLCVLIDAGLAERLGFGRPPKRQAIGSHGCDVTFDGDANGEITFGFERLSTAATAAKDFGRLHARSARLAGLGEEAALDARNGVDAWTHRLAVRHGDVLVELAYEGDPVPSGVEGLDGELIGLAQKLLAAIPVSPSCAPVGGSDACPIEVELPAGFSVTARLTGEIGKGQSLVYALGAEAEQTITIDVSGAAALAAEIRCPGVSPRTWASHGSVRLPIDGRCLVRVGARSDASPAQGSFVLTVRRE